MMASPPQAAQSMTYFLLQGLQLLFEAVNRKNAKLMRPIGTHTHTQERKDESGDESRPYTVRGGLLIPILSQRMKNNLTRHKRARYRLSSRVQR